jgi:hypothetical protein
MAISLGLIPSWQFSQDPAVNFNLNPKLSFPAGMTQQTSQPVAGALVSSNGVAGLGTPIARFINKPAGVAGLGIFDTVWWQQRKWLAGGLAALFGIGAIAFAAKFLR